MKRPDCLACECRLRFAGQADSATSRRKRPRSLLRCEPRRAVAGQARRRRRPWGKVRLLLAVIAELVSQEQMLREQVEAGLAGTRTLRSIWASPGLGRFWRPGCWLSSMTRQTGTTEPRRAGTTRGPVRSLASLASPAPFSLAMFATAASSMRFTCRPLPRSRHPREPAATTTSAAHAAPPIIKPCAPWAIGSSASCTAACAVTSTTKKTLPGHPATNSTKPPLDIFKTVGCLTGHSYKPKIALDPPLQRVNDPLAHLVDCPAVANATSTTVCGTTFERLTPSRHA